MSSLNTHDPNVSRGAAQAIDKLLTMHEVAALLGVCYETVRQRVNRGEMRHVRMSGYSIRIPSSSLSEYLERNTWPVRENQPVSSNCETVSIGTSATTSNKMAGSFAKSFQQELTMSGRLGNG